VDSNGRTDGATRGELVRAGLASDDVHLVHYADQWPVPGTRAEKRASRNTMVFFGLAILLGIAGIAIYVGWPWGYQPPTTDGYTLYSWYTPLLGITVGGALLSLAIGLFRYEKKFLPEEKAVQQRHDGPSPESGRATASAMLTDAAARSGVGRRRVMLGAAGLAAGIPMLGATVAAVGGLVRNPWRDSRPENTLWHTGWYAQSGEAVHLRRYTEDPDEVALVRPEDLDAGAYLTVFPFRESERGDRDKLEEALKRSDNPAVLFRFRPGTQVAPRPGQENYHYGDFYAYSKICTHLGCPVSLFEQQTDVLLCPCHQSQFDLKRSAEPMFGPAVRPLPQLPIDYDPNTGTLVARGDFSGPIGPGFWELGS